MTTNDKLRRLRKWIEDCHRDSDQDCDREHPKQVGMRLAWRMVRDEINNLLAEPEAQAPSKAAPPVTDAEIDDAIDVVDHAAYDHATSARFDTTSNTARCARDRFAAIDALKAIIARRVQQAESGEAYLEEKLESIERVLEQDMKGEHCRVDGGIVERAIARRVQQAGAAAEDLARAVGFALEPGPLDGKEVAMTTEIIDAARALRQEKAERLRRALAAFRAAQGGAS